MLKTLREFMKLMTKEKEKPQRDFFGSILEEGSIEEIMKSITETY